MSSLPLMTKSLNTNSPLLQRTQSLPEKRERRKSIVSQVLPIKSPLQNNFFDNSSITTKSIQSRKAKPLVVSSIVSKTQKERTSSSRKRSAIRKRLATRKILAIRKRLASRKIVRFLNRNSKFLAFRCPRSGECVSFGKQIDEITAFFDGYTGFDHVVDPITSIGVPSNNGFVKKINYEKHDYESYAILKSSMRQNADNLVYEYIVGSQYINGLLKKFPCFVQTYGHYFYKDEEQWLKFEQKPLLLKNDLKDALELQKDFDLKEACSRSKHAAILIQHIDSAKTLFFYSKNFNFVNNDSLYIFFIIYHALSQLSQNFTHYDLHSDNVLLYQPIEGGYIEYYYHLSDETIITFRCPFIPKIIDYGRSFFNNGSLSSDNIFKSIQETKECQPDDGYQFGFQWFTPLKIYNGTPEGVPLEIQGQQLPINELNGTPPEGACPISNLHQCKPDNKFFINSQKKNESHDLKLFVDINDNFINHSTTTVEKTFLYNEVLNLLKSIQYGIGIEEIASKQEIKNWYSFLKTKFENDEFALDNNNTEEQLQSLAKEKANEEAKKTKRFGTKEDTTSHLDGSITNVKDAYLRLKQIVLNETVADKNKILYSNEFKDPIKGQQSRKFKKFADFHIYEDGRPMEFIPDRSFS